MPPVPESDVDDILLLNVNQSADDKQPGWVPDAVWQLIVAFVPPNNAPNVPVTVSGLETASDVVDTAPINAGVPLVDV